MTVFKVSCSKISSNETVFIVVILLLFFSEKQGGKPTINVELFSFILYFSFFTFFFNSRCSLFAAIEQPTRGPELCAKMILLKQ